MAETDAVSTLLTGIFAEPEPEPAPPAPLADARFAPGIDPVHGNLLRELATRSSWSEGELAELAARHEVLLEGALDLINEVAIEITGEPVVEVGENGGGQLRVNDEVFREITS